MHLLKYNKVCAQMVERFTLGRFFLPGPQPPNLTGSWQQASPRWQGRIMTHTHIHRQQPKKTFPQRFSLFLAGRSVRLMWIVWASIFQRKPIVRAAATYLDYWIQPLYLVHTRRGQYITLFAAHGTQRKGLESWAHRRSDAKSLCHSISLSAKRFKKGKTKVRFSINSDMETQKNSTSKKQRFSNAHFLLHILYHAWMFYNLNNNFSKNVKVC